MTILICIYILLRIIISIIFSYIHRVVYFINKIKLLFNNIFLIIYYGVIVILPLPDIYSFPLLLSSSGDSDDDDPENHEVVENEDHNAPEEIMNDLDRVQEAK
jgi:hypothetical protein